MMIVSSVLGLRSFGGACFFRRVFHWSFESRGLEGQSQGGAVNLVFVAQMRCCFSASISLLLRSSSLSSLCSSLFLTSVTCLTLYSHRSPPQQKCIFQSNLVSDKIYPPTKKYLHYTLYLYCKDRKEGNLFRLPLSGTLTAEVIINFPIDAIFCYSELCEKKPLSPVVFLERIS